jgi:hypothetical protein
VRFYTHQEEAMVSSTQLGHIVADPPDDLGQQADNHWYAHYVCAGRNGGRKPKQQKPSRKNPLRSDKKSFQ